MGTTPGGGAQTVSNAANVLRQPASFFPVIVNGKEDLQTPIADLYILLEYGSTKSARVFPGGHMGQTPETLPTIINWLKNELS